MVSKGPDRYILKPQREGGGNNIYGERILDFLNNKSAEELKSYILMGKIFSTPHIGLIMKNKKLDICPVISELGIFGYTIR